MSYLYTLSVVLYGISIRLAALFIPKAKAWIQGRKGLFSLMENKLAEHRPTAWFHCASLGEFEQGRPVLEAFKEKYPDYRILLTFFSPSGYEVRKNYPGADLILYLPLDTPSNVKRFLDISKPDLVLIIKYEYWYNFINQLITRNIPIYIVSGIFRRHQHFFRWYGGWFRSRLKQITYFFLQNQESLELLASIGIKRACVSGDTRFDRVLAIAANPFRFPSLEEFGKENGILLAGSTWPEDEALLFPLFQEPGFTGKIIIAPHEVHPERITGIIEKAPIPAIRFSLLNEAPPPSVRLIVVDTIGQLSSLYQYAGLAYIGGGFGRGIHNILEAATFGLPVIFGPNYQKFLEARELIIQQAAFTVHSTKEINALIQEFFKHKEKREATGERCKQYVRDKSGATQVILHYLKTNHFTNHG